MTPPPQRPPSPIPGQGPARASRFLPVDHWPPARPEDGEPTVVRALAADSAGGPLAVAATERGAVRVWDTATGEPVGRPCADDGGAGQVALTRLAGRPVAVTAGGDEGAVRLFDVLTGRPLGDPLTDTGPSAALAVAAARSPLLVAGRLDGTTRVWDLSAPTAEGVVLSEAGPPLAVATATAPDGRPYAVTVTPDDGGGTGGGRSGGGRTDGGGTDFGTVRLWDLSTLRPLGEPLGQGAEVHTAALAFPSPDGDPVVVTAGWDKAVRLWDPFTARPLGAPLTATDGARALVTAHLAGRPVAATAPPGASGAVRLWDLLTRRPLGPDHRVPHPVRALAATPSGVLLAATGPHVVPLPLPA